MKPHRRYVLCGVGWGRVGWNVPKRGFVGVFLASFGYSSVLWRLGVKAALLRGTGSLFSASGRDMPLPLLCRARGAEKG